MPNALLSQALGEGIAVVGRRPNRWASTFPSEILTCESEGKTTEVLAKFSSDAGRPAFGHRSGVTYEAAVYRDILSRVPLPTPRFWGSCETPTGTGLLIEFLGEGSGVDEHSSPADALRAAARWIGEFQAWWEQRPAPQWLHRYDERYYSQWARRTAALAGDWHRRLPWLLPLCNAAGQLGEEMAANITTVIHGEFTPSNVLIQGGLIKPVDWESCAIGLGEIDLVSLIEGWPAEVGQSCLAAYRKVYERPGHERRLDLAGLYWHLRWLGERADWLSKDHVLQRAPHLLSVGERLGIV